MSREVVDEMLDEIERIFFTSAEAESDKKMKLEAVNKDGLYLRRLSREDQADSDIVLAAVLQNWVAFGYASVELKNNKEQRIYLWCSP